METWSAASAIGIRSDSAALLRPQGPLRLHSLSGIPARQPKRGRRLSDRSSWKRGPQPQPLGSDRIQRPFFVHKAHYAFTPFPAFLQGNQSADAGYLTDHHGNVVRSLSHWDPIGFSGPSSSTRPTTPSLPFRHSCKATKARTPAI